MPNPYIPLIASGSWIIFLIFCIYILRDETLDKPKTKEKYFGIINKNFLSNIKNALSNYKIELLCALLLIGNIFAIKVLLKVLSLL